MTHPLPLTAKTLFAELREQMLADAAAPRQRPEKGSFTTKTVKGQAYGYYQYGDLSGKQRQVYLGPLSDPDVADIQARLQAPDRGENLASASLAKSLRAMTGTDFDARTFRVIEAFADAGFFHDQAGGGVLVGTNAYKTLAPLLGVQWDAMTATQDVDIAANASVQIALKPKGSVTPGDVLESLKMGFAPVPTLNPKFHSTSYHIRGNELRVDLLTTTRGKPEGEQFIPSLNSYAQRMLFMDYLIEGAIQLPLIGPRKAVMVNTPAPERFALHKLLVSESRPSAMIVKAEKDRRQALEVLQVLLDEAPDSVETAVHDLVGRGPGWRKRLYRAIERMAVEARAIAGELSDMALNMPDDLAEPDNSGRSPTAD